MKYLLKYFYFWSTCELQWDLFEVVHYYKIHYSYWELYKNIQLFCKKSNHTNCRSSNIKGGPFIRHWKSLKTRLSWKIIHINAFKMKVNSLNFSLDYVRIFLAAAEVLEKISLPAERHRQEMMVIISFCVFSRCFFLFLKVTAQFMTAFNMKYLLNVWKIQNILFPEVDACVCVRVCKWMVYGVFCAQRVVQIYHKDQIICR